jgi:outer membrane protein, heavy metal efflux system
MLRGEWRVLLAGGLLATGCSATSDLPMGHLPDSAAKADVLLPASFQTVRPTLPVTTVPGKIFELPPILSATTRPDSKIDTLPQLGGVDLGSGEPLTLPQLQEIANSSNPQLQQVQTAIDAAAGLMQQAGLYPNPTVGYQADQMQPWAFPSGTPGQQGAYISQLIKTAGKLELSQQVAGYDQLNAMVEARRTQVEVYSQIRSQFFALLVAQQSIEIQRSLVSLADEVYQLQKKQVRAGEAAAYEPLQLYAQAVQARNALKQAEATATASWRQLAASLGQPDLPLKPLAGRADATPPVLNYELLKSRLIDQHTDLLTARNKQMQAEANLRFQQVTPIPDLQTNTYIQYDNVVRTTQFGVQLGVSLPLYDRNQGNIRAALANLSGAQLAIPAMQNSLTAKLAEAFARYETSQTQAKNYADLVLPNLTSAYRAMIRRYQIEPEKVQFNDIVVAQQNLAQALQAYLNTLDAQWKAVVDLASLAQLDELYSSEEVKPKK